jgi:hypothetical protein
MKSDNGRFTTINIDGSATSSATGRAIKVFQVEVAKGDKDHTGAIRQAAVDNLSTTATGAPNGQSSCTSRISTRHLEISCPCW